MLFFIIISDQILSVTYGDHPSDKATFYVSLLVVRFIPLFDDTHV